MLNILLKL